jgi:hypothetical protein
MSTLEEQITLYNVAATMILQQADDEGEQVFTPGYWNEFMKDHPDHAAVYAQVAEEMSYYRAMAPTFEATGCTTLQFMGEPGESWEVDLTTFQKSIIDETSAHEEVDVAL